MYYAIDSSEGMIFPLIFLFTEFSILIYVKWKTLIKNFEFCYEHFSSFSNIYIERRFLLSSPVFRPAKDKKGKKTSKNKKTKNKLFLLG